MPSRDLPPRTAVPPRTARKVTFTGPGQYILWMGVFLGAVTAIAILLHGPLVAAFEANPAINGLILGVLLIGIVYLIATLIAVQASIQGAGVAIGDPYFFADDIATGRLIQPDPPWTRWLMTRAFSIIAPSTSASTIGGRGQPPRFITKPMTPKTRQVIQSPRWALPSQEPINRKRMTPGTT
jgi:hypothetical protein